MQKSSSTVCDQKKMPDSKVYVVQQHFKKNKDGVLVQRFDLDPAKEFGELTFLLGPGAKPYNSREVVAELSTGLEEFSDVDSLLLIGNPCLIGFATSIAAQCNSGRVAVLQWSGTSRKYSRIVVDLFE